MRRPCIRVYTPHGGSLHYSRSSPVGLLYLTLEQMLMARTELFLFESRYGRDVSLPNRHAKRAGKSRAQRRHGGGFAEVAPQPDATDIVFIGELRLLKGVDVLARRACLSSRERRVTATIVGDGPDAGQFREQAEGWAWFFNRFLTPMPPVSFQTRAPARRALAPESCPTSSSKAAAPPSR